MNANIINLKVSNLPAVALIPLAVFSFAERAAAQASTAPQPVITRDSILQVPAQTSRDLGLPSVADNRPADKDLLVTPPPVPLNFAQDFAGFRNAQTLPLGGVEILEGFDFNYREQTRDDVQRTAYNYTLGNTLLQVGMGKGFEFYGSIPIQLITDTTIKDSTGQDSSTHYGTGAARFGIQYNFLGNAGGPYFLSGSVDGLYSSWNNDRTRLPFSGSPLSDTNNTTDNHDRRDRNRNSDDWGGGVSVQAAADVGWGTRIGIDSGLLVGHPDCCCGCCCCCVCFDNRLNLTKTFCDKWAVEATLATTFSTARKSDVQAVILGGVRWTPRPWLGLYAGPTWNATQNGDNIGGMFQASIQWDMIR
jgi:hypothetical protein